MAETAAELLIWRFLLPGSCGDAQGPQHAGFLKKPLAVPACLRSRGASDGTTPGPPMIAPRVHLQYLAGPADAEIRVSQTFANCPS